FSFLRVCTSARKKPSKTPSPPRLSPRNNTAWPSARSPPSTPSAIFSPASWSDSSGAPSTSRPPLPPPPSSFSPVHCSSFAFEPRASGPFRLSNKGVFNRDTKIFLARIQVFRPDFLTAAALGGGNDHSVVKVHSVLSADLHGTEHDISIDRYELDRPKRVYKGHHIFGLSGPISNSELKLLEAALQGLPFPALPACRGFLPCEFVQILANKASQRRVAIYRNFANAFHQLFWQRQRDIHVPIIRDSLIL